MNCLKQYVLLMKKRLADPPDESVYSEKHHIFPVSIYGKNNLVVRLTLREHIIAHYLLFKGLLKRYGKYDKRTIKMHCALRYFCSSNRRNQENISYKKVQKLLKTLSKRGEIKHSEETKQKISESNKGKCKGKRPWNKNKTLPPLSEEHKEKISAGLNRPECRSKRKSALKGKFVGDKNPMYGRNHTEEAKKVISDKKKGKTLGELNPNYKGERFTWVNAKLGVVEIDLTVKELVAKYVGLRCGALYRVKDRKAKSHLGWTVQIYDNQQSSSDNV